MIYTKIPISLSSLSKCPSTSHSWRTTGTHHRISFSHRRHFLSLAKQGPAANASPPKAYFLCKVKFHLQENKEKNWIFIELALWSLFCFVNLYEISSSWTYATPFTISLTDRKLMRNTRMLLLLLLYIFFFFFFFSLGLFLSLSGCLIQSIREKKRQCVLSFVCCVYCLVGFGSSIS